MKRMCFLKLFSLFFALAIVVHGGDRIPCRIKAQESPIMFMTLGNVETPVAEGYFLPEKDLVVLKNGSSLSDYYRTRLGITYYAPIDKTRFPLPPSGWCSWYFYYQEINAEEVLKNARWIAENLREYGARYVQIDDGWQGTGHGLGENRDWFTIDRRFRNPGMKTIAEEIKKLGLKPGLWLAPHGQSNSAVVKRFKNAFFLTPDGKSLSSTWEGTYLVKPSKEGMAYLRHLFKTLKSWGYEYFKIDGQPIVIREYKKLLGKKGVNLYRQTLKVIRETIGPNTYLLGCWGIPLAGVGIMNGSRTGGDVRLGWEGFFVAFDATMRWYFLHNVVWYSDPDVILVRPPMSKDIALAWATLQGLTGQALMASDRMYALPKQRVEILKKIYPAVDIRPMDLFPSNAYKKIWDLKISHLGRNYDVVAVFNFTDKEEGELLNFSQLGLKKSSLYHVFDFWNQEYLGSWKGGYYVKVPARGVRVLTLMEQKDHPLLLSTSRHITQGWVELKELKQADSFIAGKSYIIRSDNYTLFFAYPRGRCYKIASVESPVKTKIRDHRFWSEVTFYPQKSGLYPWQVRFEKTSCYRYPVKAPSRILEIKLISPDEYLIKWWPLYSLTAGYNVYLNGQLAGYTPEAEIKVKIDDLKTEHTVEIKGVWYDGIESEKSLSFVLKAPSVLPKKVFLSDLKPLFASAGWSKPQYDLSVDGAGLSIAGRKFKKGIGTHAPSKIKYYLGGAFTRFKSWVGIDDETAGKGSVIFRILGDGKVLWESGKMKAGQIKQVKVSLRKVKVLCLEVDDAGDGKDFDHADWANPLLIRE